MPGRTGPHDDRLRDLERRDQTAVRDLILRGMRERWHGRYDASANPDVDDMRSTYVLQGGEVVVCEADARIVATGTLMPEADGGGRILRMSVDGNYRRRGLGRVILRELVERAMRRGLTPLRVTTDTQWSEAVALYAGCGFEITSQTTTDTQLEMRLRRD